MCGRFTLLTDLSVVVESFHIQAVDVEYKKGNNISPGQQLSAIIHDDKNRLVCFRWGLIPSWAKDPSVGNKMFNARAETIAEKPSFREAFKRRRCLIVADGFYEWQKIDRINKPLRFSLKSGGLLVSRAFMKPGSHLKRNLSIPARSSRRSPMTSCDPYMTECRSL